MSAKIIEVTSGDNAIQLGYHQMGRTMSIGSTWNDIRIVARVKMAEASQIIKADVLRLGVQAGTTNFVRDVAGPTNYFGMTNEYAFDYTAGSPDYFSAASSQWQTMRKRGTTTTVPLSFLSTANDRIFSTTNHTLIGFRIQKTTPSDTKFAFLHHDSASSPADMSNAQFITALEGTFPSGYSENTPGITGGPWDVDEATYGDLDTVVVAWASNFQQLIVTDIGVGVIS